MHYPSLLTSLILSALPLVPRAGATREAGSATPARQVGDSGQAGGAQDKDQEAPPRKVVSGLGTRGSLVVLNASDGKPVEAGRIPDDTKADARELWELVLRGTRSSSAETPPVEGFHLTFDMTARHEGGKNDIALELAYRMREGYLRTDILRSKRTQLRGPDGDFLIEKGSVTRLAGREHKQSREDMDQWVAIAHNFLTLTNPAAIRIVAMREVGAPSDRLPAEVRREIGGLRWLEVESPDFHLYSTDESEKAPVFVAQLALRPHTARVEYSLIQERGRRGDRDARLFAHKEFEQLQGFLLPRNVLVYLVDPTDRGLAFFAKPSIDLWMHPNGQLNPDLSLDHFRPLPK